MEIIKDDVSLKIRCEDALKLAEMLMEDEHSYVDFNTYIDTDGKLKYIYINNYLREDDYNIGSIHICINFLDCTLEVSINHGCTSKLFHVGEADIESLANKALIRVKNDARKILRKYLNKLEDEKS